MARPIGIILYEGPSQLDGITPIVVIANCLGKSANSKTGNMIQTHILLADVSPVEANRRALDVAICGSCRLQGDAFVSDSGKGQRPGRLCYVRIEQAQTGIFKAYRRGSYATYNPELHDKYLSGRGIRLGSYGDPAAAPIAIWQSLKALAAYTTGYTHQWRDVSPDWSKLVMASADTAGDYSAAKLIGYRTFRVGLEGDAKVKGEVSCPASAEAGKKLQCDTCQACSGVSGKHTSSVFIKAHGAASGTKVEQAYKQRLIAIAA